jgi:hypothetical protein
MTIALFLWLLIFLLAVAMIVFTWLGLQFLSTFRYISTHLFHIAADQRQQIIELQVITAGLSGLAGCLESYLEQPVAS